MSIQSTTRSSSILDLTTAAFPLPQYMACCSLAANDHTVVWDKNVLEGYAGEPGLSPLARLAAIAGVCGFTWAAIGAAYAALQVYTAAS